MHVPVDLEEFYLTVAQYSAREPFLQLCVRDLRRFDSEARF
jgi:hypothetical protein